MNIQIENRLNGDTVTLEKIKNKGSDELIKSEGFLELGHENDKHDDNMNIVMKKTNSERFTNNKKTKKSKEKRIVSANSNIGFTNRKPNRNNTMNPQIILNQDYIINDSQSIIEIDEKSDYIESYVKKYMNKNKVLVSKIPNFKSKTNIDLNLKASPKSTDLLHNQNNHNLLSPSLKFNTKEDKEACVNFDEDNLNNLKYFLHSENDDNKNDKKIETLDNLNDIITHEITNNVSLLKDLIKKENNEIIKVYNNKFLNFNDEFHDNLKYYSRKINEIDSKIDNGISSNQKKLNDLISQLKYNKIQINLNNNINNTINTNNNNHNNNFLNQTVESERLKYILSTKSNERAITLTSGNINLLDKKEFKKSLIRQSSGKFGL